MLFYGEGIKQNQEQAVFWYKKAAHKNDAKALYNLGLCYESGEGVLQSNRWAEFYFLKASKLGYRKARNKVKRITNSVANHG
ncbi:MAG: sel1 repeat family protein [Bacteroidales bacterium]|nr:sel1 repeat family protein [Bacteroidales bacterium]